MIIPVNYLPVHFQYKSIPKEKTIPELVFEYGNGLFFLFFQEGSLLADQKWASSESAFFIPSAAFFGRDGVRFGCCFCLSVIFFAGPLICRWLSPMWKTVPDKTSIYVRLKLDQGLIERQPRLGWNAGDVRSKSSCQRSPPFCVFGGFVWKGEGRSAYNVISPDP